MAITKSATRSSTMARGSSWTRARVPAGASSAGEASANGVSVDIAAPQPCAVGLPAFNARKIATGSAIPPSAATTGIETRERSRSWPRSSSRLASRPTTRKNSVIRPWLTQSRRSIAIAWSPTRIDSTVRQNDSYESDHGEFAHTSAATVAPSSAAAPAVSVLRKARSGAARFPGHAVRPVWPAEGAASSAVIAPASAIARHIFARRASRAPAPGSEDAADLGRERADVLGGDLPRAAGVAVADGLEQLAVLAHALGQVRQAVEHEVPDAQREVEVAPERLLEVRVRARAVDEAVDLGVELDELVAVRAAGRVDAREERLELAPARRRQPLRGAVRGVALELLADVGDLCEVGDVDLGRERA